MHSVVEIHIPKGGSLRPIVLPQPDGSTLFRFEVDNSATVSQWVRPRDAARAITEAEFTDEERAGQVYDRSEIEAARVHAVEQRIARLARAGRIPTLGNLVDLAATCEFFTNGDKK